MASRYDQNYSYTGDGGAVTDGTFRVNSEGKTVINLPDGGRALVDPVTGTGQAPGLGSFTFTPGLTGSDLVQTIGGIAAMTGGGGAGSAGGGTGGTSGAAGSSSSGGPYAGLLRQAGLEELAPEVDAWVRQGLTWPEIEARLMDVSTTAGKVVDRLYPELREYRENPTNAGLPPINIAAIQEYRQTFQRFVKDRGYDAAFPDTESIRNATRQWIVAGKSMEEMAGRFRILEDNAVVMAQTDPALQAQLDAWQRFYGVAPTTGDLVSMALKPQEATPAIERRFAAVRFDREAGLAGFGDLSKQEAEGLVDLGVDAKQSGSAFGALASSRELFTALDRGEDDISRQDQLGAAFTNSAAARRRIEERGRRRTAAFEGGGGLATSRRGFGGLATSSDA